MGFPLYIAKRYLFSKSGTNAVNIITLVSVASIIIGTTVLLVVLSAFSGLKDFNLSIISIIDPDIKVLPAQGKTLQFTPAREKALKEVSGIVSFSKVIEERAYLEYDGKTHLAFIKGVDKKYLDVSRIDTTLFAGSWPGQAEPEVAIGAGIRRRLSLALGDYGTLLKIMVPRPGKGQVTDPSQAFSRSSAVASGIFQAGESIDNDHLFTNIDFVGDLLNYDLNTISTLEIKLDPLANEEKIRSEIEAIFHNKAITKNRMELNETLYKMLNTENLALYFICILVLIIALFSFIGSIIMIIIDKRKHIRTLSDLGATIPKIRLTFFLQGALMILTGGVIGVLLGAIIVFIQQQFGLIRITESLAYPVKLEFTNLLVVLGTILLLGMLASRLAASKITKNLITKS